MAVRYRKALRTDCIPLAKLAVQMWTSHTLSELEIEFASILSSENNVIFIAEDNGNFVGFSQCSIRHDYVEGTRSSPVGYLEGIFVEECYRNKYIAKELLQCCEQWARENDCSEFASDCAINNEVSRQFHISVGFNETNRIICFTKRI